MLARDRKVAFGEMIEVMRGFLGRQIGGDTTDMTTGELVAWLEELDEAKIAPGRKQEVIRWLDSCEEGKFGSRDTTVDEGRVHIAHGRELVIGIAAPSMAPSAEAAVA
jgi:hypothetical protein